MVLGFWVRVCEHRSHGCVVFEEPIAMVVGLEARLVGGGLASALQREGRVGVRERGQGGRE